MAPAFCEYTEGDTILPPDASHPRPRRIPGDKRRFRFGHLYPHGSEYTLRSYRFEIDSSLSRFVSDSAQYPELAFEQEMFAPPDPSMEKQPAGRLEGERTSDSTWRIREWISEDYREWRRRESYRKVPRDPGPQPGYERECVRLSRRHLAGGEAR